MDKNLILAIALSTIVFVTGFSIQARFFPPEAQPAQTASEEAELSLPQEAIEPSASMLDYDKAGESLVSGIEEDSLEEELFVIETDLVKVTFTNRGGDILSYLIKEGDGQAIEMAEFASESNRAFSIMFGDAGGVPVNRIFNARRIGDNSIGFYAEFATRGAGGKDESFVLAKRYTFQPDDYMFELAVSIEGNGGFSGLDFDGVAYTLSTSPQIGPEWDAGRDRYDYRRFQYMDNGKQRRISLAAGQARDVEADFQWAGVVSKYFTLIAVPESFQLGKARYSTVAGGEGESAAKLYLSRPSFRDSAVTDIWHVYAGPRTERELAAYNHQDNNPFGLSGKNLNQAVESSGVLAPLEVVLKWIMEVFHKIIPNWGVSIIFMTVLMRLIIFPLTRKSSESTLKMQALQPKIAEIQQKYQNNPQKMNEEMAKLYKDIGYSPVSGCLPLFIQLPLLFAMFNIFNNYFEFRGAMFIPGWISDLSKGDSIYTLSFNIPFGLGNQVRLLPIIYVVSQIIFSKVTQPGAGTGQAGSMKFMMYGMPLIFFFLFYNAPSGLLLYWIFSNLLTLAQQVVINKMLQRKREAQAEESPNSVKFPGEQKNGSGKKAPPKKRK